MVVNFQREGVINLGIEHCVERYYPAVVGLHRLVILHIVCACVEQYAAVGWCDARNVWQTYIHRIAPNGEGVIYVREEEHLTRRHLLHSHRIEFEITRNHNRVYNLFILLQSRGTSCGALLVRRVVVVVLFCLRRSLVYIRSAEGASCYARQKK